MNQKKTKLKKKQTTNIQKNKLIKIFLSIFLIALLASAFSYFIMKYEKHSKPSKIDNILETKKETLKKDIPKDVEEMKLFEYKKPQEYFDELIPTPEKHEKFEEYTQEFEKDIIEKDDNEDLINKENEKVLKKIEEIKEEKKKESIIVKDTQEEEK
jgi:hypothetical protein